MNSELFINVFALIISAVLPLSLAWLVWSRNTQSHLRTLYVSFQLSVVLWAIFNFLSVTDFFSADFRFVCIRATMCLAIWQSMTFFLFVHTLPDEKMQLGRRSFIALIICSLITSALCFSPLVFSGFQIVNRELEPLPNFGIILFALNSVGLIAYGVGILTRRLSASTGMFRGQLYALLLGFCSTFGLLVFFNFIVVIVFHNASFVHVGGVFFLPLVVAMSYAMLLYRFFGVELSVHKGMLAIATKVVVLFVLTMTSVVLIHFFTYAPLVIILMIVISSVAYECISKKIEYSWLNQFFFFDRIDSSVSILRELNSGEIAHMLKGFEENIRQFCAKNNIDYKGVAVLHREKYMFEPLSSGGSSFLVSSPVAIALYSLSESTADVRMLELMRSKYASELVDYMKSKNSTNTLVLHDKNAIIGCIFFAQKGDLEQEIIEKMHNTFSSQLISILRSKEGLFVAKSSQ